MSLRTWWTGSLVGPLAAAVLVIVATSVPSAGTPDDRGARRTACGDLSGGAFGLCNAYCEAQGCNAHPRPSCAELRKNFLKLTGRSTFPCEIGRAHV